MTHWIRRYGGSLLLVVLAFAYITRIYNLHLPEGYMFDEVYHAVTAKLIAQNDPRAYEWWNPPPEPNTAVDWLHPPLAKYFQAASILAFGENSFGWRFSSVVFGMLVIVAIYHLTMELFNNQEQAVGAAALASLDGLLLVQSRIAMNDIFVTFFILLTVLFYVRLRKTRQTKTLFLVGFSAGLAVASKWSGLFILGAVIGWEVIQLVGLYVQNKLGRLIKKKGGLYLFQQVSLYFLALIIVPAVVYFLSYTQMFLQGKDLDHFLELHRQIWHYQTHLEATHPYQSRPWQWALDIRPVWYHVDYLGGSRGDIYAFGNPALFWLGVCAITYTALLSMQKISLMQSSRFKLKTKLQKLLTAINTSPFFILLVSYFIVWLPWQLSPRIMFFYHYTPAVPFLCIILAYWLGILFKKNKNTRIASIVFWSSIIVCFVIWYPQWVGIPMSNKVKNSFYFAVPSWK